MKKTILTVLTLAVLLLAATGAAAAAGVSVYVDDRQVAFPDQAPFIDENARTLVPIRFIAEQMGAEVGWDGSINLVTIVKGTAEIKLTIGEKRAQVNGAWKTFDTNAVLHNNRTMVPLRFISETLGARVEWDNDTRTVYIYTDENTAPVVEPGYEYEVINGFKVPKETDMIIDGLDTFNNVEIAFRIDIDRPMQVQLNQAKAALESKFGQHASIDQAIAYAGQKTGRGQTLVSKYFEINGHRIQVGSDVGNYFTSIIVRKK